MEYDLKNIPNENLKQLLAVMDDLAHKADLSASRGPLAFGNAPKGVNKDEQLAILSRLENDNLVSRSINGKWIYLNEYANKTFEEFYEAVHNEHHKRIGATRLAKKVLPHYDLTNGILHIGNYPVKIKVHEDNDKQHLLLKHIFIDNAKDIGREFDFTEFPFDEEDIKKFKGICRTACTAINKKIAKETKNTIADFLEFNSLTYGFLNLNPKYLQ